MRRFLVAVFCLLCLLLATLLGAVAQVDAATHPNQKKISKWTAKQTKLQGKIDAENARTTTGPTTVYTVRRTYTVQAAPTFVMSAPEPAPELVEAPAPVYVAPQVQVYRSVPVYRTYRVAPVLACPIFGGVFGGIGADGLTWSERRHARLAEKHAAKADYHASQTP